jgi:hypothetical protein
VDWDLFIRIAGGFTLRVLSEGEPPRIRNYGRSPATRIEGKFYPGVVGVFSPRIRKKSIDPLQAGLPDEAAPFVFFLEWE